MAGAELYVSEGVHGYALVHVQYVLRGWKMEFSDPILLRPEQPDPAWRKMERLLRRHGWAPGLPLTYRQVQALGSWRDVVLCSVPPDKSGHSGGGAPQPDQHAPTQSDAGGASAAPRRGRKPQQRTATPVRLWHPWPQPSQALIARASAMLSLIQEELAEDARESIAVGWRHERLAVRQEMGQLDPARHWERLTLPRLLLALDFSGSMGGFISEVVALGATLAHVFPWLVVAGAPNAWLGPLTMIPDKEIIVDGAWQSLPPAPPPSNEDRWRMIDRLWPVRAAIYVGDWEAFQMADAFPGRFGALSVYQARHGAPIRTDRAYGQATPWPTIIRCNTVDDFLSALPVLIRAVLI